MKVEEIEQNQRMVTSRSTNASRVTRPLTSTSFVPCEGALMINCEL